MPELFVALDGSSPLQVQLEISFFGPCKPNGILPLRWCEEWYGFSESGTSSRRKPFMMVLAFEYWPEDVGGGVYSWRRTVMEILLAVWEVETAEVGRMLESSWRLF